MKAWKKLHYDRASAFLSVFTGAELAPSSSPQETSSVPVETDASQATATAKKPEITAAAVAIDPPANPASEPPAGATQPPLVKVLPTSTAPAVAPAREAPQGTDEQNTSEAPVKITPQESVAERAPNEAGKFFAGITWVGGPASFEAANEPDSKPGISIQPAPETQTQSPPDRSNPILAATRSALVTAEKVSTPPIQEGEAENQEERTASEPATATAPKPIPTENETGENAAAFFKNLNWKNN